MSFFREINLPTSILIQAVGFTGFGLYLNIFRRMPWQTRSTVISPQTRLALRNHDTVSILGAACAALGLAYLSTSYVPISENQMLHASVPVRLFVSVLFMGRLLVTRREGFSQEGYWEHVGLAIFDFLGATWAGVVLGRWDGTVD